MRVTNARLRARGGLWDIDVDGGLVRSVVPARAGGDVGDGPGGASPGREVFDAAGRLVTPPFVDNHIHLDYANTAGTPRANRSGTLFEGIEIWAERKAAANLVVLDAEDDATAVREKAEVLLSVHRGREVFRRRPAETTWAL